MSDEGTAKVAATAGATAGSVMVAIVPEAWPASVDPSSKPELCPAGPLATLSGGLSACCDSIDMNPLLGGGRYDADDSRLCHAVVVGGGKPCAYRTSSCAWSR